ncbi:flagellar hook-associated protein FlgK [Couchioplanes caeruleus]|uniref:flagellar hook-associated protein FlgK n=1 Tax=Couchioplanes caeruleus TaxID=56438 RepID=UPI00201C8925|nr:flagellar hook-associated protein FlgK [Couchioplanes caeruleus]UQU65433.1 flagellar hook-associated protein FlgK [Couchioplanes caeruleus]
MGSSFGSINTALTSLYAQRRGLDVAGQNIANATTEGYTRQRVDMQAQVGSTVGVRWATTDGLGTGVAVSDVQRLRDQYLENRGRTEHANSAYLSNQAATYTSLEDVFAEPSSTALQAQMHDMWAAWGDVGDEPTSVAARSALLQQSSVVAEGLNSAYGALDAQWSANATQLTKYAAEVNTAAGTIAQLNDSIVKAKATGVVVNELEDRRDLAVMKLSELVGATASVRDDGSMDVYVGNALLVNRTTTRPMTATAGVSTLDAQRDYNANPANGTKSAGLTWVDTGDVVQAGGRMGSMTETMTTILPGMAQKLDKVAKTLVDTVNAATTSAYKTDGTAGTEFFTGDFSTGRYARNITVAITNPKDVAISAKNETNPDGTPKLDAGGNPIGTNDGSKATTLAGTATKVGSPDLVYQDMIADLGVNAQTSTRRSEIQVNVTAQVDAAREAESGVNLDEEMTNLLTYQRGYEAASRVLTTIDSMLDQLINRTGLVGR